MLNIKTETDMKTKSISLEDIKSRIARKFDEPVERVLIEDLEPRENWKGKSLHSGNPVYVIMNSGVDGEEVKEFAGWIINGKWYRQ